MRAIPALLVLVSGGVVSGIRWLALLEILVDGGGHHEALLLVTQVLELGVLEGLPCTQSVVRVLRQQFADQFAAVLADVRNQLVDASALFVCKVEVHVASVFLEA